MNVHNAYTYHMILTAFKILKYKTPSSVHSLVTISKNKDTLLVNQSHDNHGFCTNNNTI
jgi:hypothetical protein